MPLARAYGRGVAAGVGADATGQPTEALRLLAVLGMMGVRLEYFIDHTFAPRPSVMSTALSTEREIHPRATVASQDLTVAPLEQTAAYSGEQIPWILDIYTWAYVFAPSFMYVDVSSCAAKRSINVLETSTRHRTPTCPLGPRRLGRRAGTLLLGADLGSRW